MTNEKCLTKTHKGFLLVLALATVVTAQYTYLTMSNMAELGDPISALRPTIISAYLLMFLSGISGIYFGYRVVFKNDQLDIDYFAIFAYNIVIYSCFLKLLAGGMNEFSTLDPVIWYRVAYTFLSLPLVLSMFGYTPFMMYFVLNRVWDEASKSNTPPEER